MAEFDAGSIMGQLDIDRDPFEDGLRLAREQAEEFEDREIRPRVTLDADDARQDIEELGDRLDELGERDVTATVGVDARDASLDLDELDRRLDELEARRVTVDVNANTGNAANDIQRASNAADDAEHSFMGLSATSAMMVSGLLSIAPALVPIAGIAAGLGTALAGGFLQGGLALGSFALIAKADFSSMQADTKALAAAQKEMESATTTQEKAKAVSDLAAAESKLTGPVGAAAKSYSTMQLALAGVEKSTAPAVFGVLSKAFQLAATLLPEIAPLVTATAHALSGVLGQVGGFLGGSTFKQFLDLTAHEVGPALNGIVKVLLEFGDGALRLFMALNPLLTMTGHAVDDLAKKFDSWAKGMQNGGIETFFSYLHTYGPPLMDMFKQLGDLAITLWKALSGGSTGSIDFITQVVHALNEMAPALSAIVQLIDPFEQLFEAILPVAVPIVNALGQAAMMLLPVVSTLIGLFRDGLNAALPIVMQLLRDLMNDIIRPLVPVVIQLINSFRPLIPVVFNALAELLPSINDLMKQLGGVLVAAVQAVIPLVPPFISLVNMALKPTVAILNPLIKALGDMIGWLKPIMPVLVPLLAALRLLPILLGAVRTAFMLLTATNPVLLAISVAVIALAALTVLVVKNWGPISRFFEGLWNDVYGFFKKYGAYILDIILPFIGIPLTIVQHWGAISHFFESLWNDVYGFFKKYGAYILDVIFPFLGIPLTIYQHWNQIIGWFEGIWQHVYTDVKNWWNDILSFFRNIPSALIGLFSAAAGWLVNAGEWIMTGLWNGIKFDWNAISSFFEGLPGLIMGFFSGAIGWLEGIGEDIINGLWNGIKRVWNDLTGWLTNSVGDVSKIVSKVLGIFSPSRVMMQLGVYTMQGFHLGMQGVYESDIIPLMNRIGTELSGFNPKIGAHAQVTMAASVAVAGQAQAAAVLQSSMDELTNAVKALPAQTGDAVGSKVGDAFDATTKKSTRQLIAAGRAS